MNIMAEFNAPHQTFHYWWVEEKVFLAGPSPAGCDRLDSRKYLQFLLAQGMRTFINLQEEDEVIRKDNAFYHDRLAMMAADLGVEVSCVRLPITDGTAINHSTLVLILDMIDSSLKNNRPVYLHCMAGHGRTATVVGCWLVRKGLTGSQALKKITYLRESNDYLLGKASPQRESQVERVREWRE